jgi:large subunit ribosomal protein L16
MLQPKRTKYRKQQRGNVRTRATSGTTLHLGEYGLQALKGCWLTARQIEAARVAITRYMRRTGKLWLRVFPDKPVTKKPAETRMGKGKGDVKEWVAVVRAGKILFELEGVPEEEAREAFRIAAHKLPIPVRFVKREEGL